MLYMFSKLSVESALLCRYRIVFFKPKIEQSFKICDGNMILRSRHCEKKSVFGKGRC